MTTPKSDWALLAELREEFQRCQAADLETRRARVLGLIDELRTGVEERNNRRGDTIRVLQNAFLAGVAPGGTLSLEEHAQRFEDLEKTISGLDATGLLYLFFSLEYEAANKIYSLYALAQTVDPARIKEQCHWLPDSLVRNTDRALKAEKIAGGSKGNLPPEKLEAYRQHHAHWLMHGGKNKTTFDTQMGHEYGRSPEVMARYRRRLESEKNLRN